MEDIDEYGEDEMEESLEEEQSQDINLDNEVHP